MSLVTSDWVLHRTRISPCRRSAAVLRAIHPSSSEPRFDLNRSTDRSSPLAGTGCEARTEQVVARPLSLRCSSNRRSRHPELLRTS